MIRQWFAIAPDSLARRHIDQGRAPLMVCMNLIWVCWLFGDVIFNTDALSARWWLVTLSSLTVFLPLYMAGYVRPTFEIRRYAFAIAALGLAVLPFNSSGGSTYTIFACAFLGFAPAPRQAVKLIVSTIVVFALATVWRGWPWTITATMSFIAFSVGVGNIFYRQNWRREAELKLSHDEVRRLAAMAERERIGRDLHDLLGHTLSLITLKLELSRRVFDNNPVLAKREIEEAESVARHALAEVRAAVTGIRATGMAAELASAKLLLNASGVYFEYTQALPALGDDIEPALSLVLREAVTNIHRHARATRAEATLRIVDGELHFRISDNGRGGVRDQGNGLCGMHERIRALHGKLVVDSPRGTGTKVHARIPLDRKPLSAAAVSVPTALASVQALSP